MGWKIEFSFWRASLFGFVCLFLFLLARTTGMHCDENNYLYLAKFSYIGTTHMDGKPPFYYILNYLIYHLFGWLLGEKRLFFPYIFYMGMFSASLAFLAQAAFEESRKRWALFLLLLFHPFSLMNSTQVMMETLLLVVLSFLLGALLYERREKKLFGQRRNVSILIFLLAGTALALKITVFPAIALFALLFLDKNYKRFWIPLFLGTFLSYLVVKVTLLRLHAPKMDYGGILNLLNVKHVMGAIPIWPTYIGLWQFFIFPFLIAGALGWFFYQRMVRTAPKEQKLFDLKLVLLSVLSLIGSLAFVCMTNYDRDLNQFRWQFPIYWSAILFLSIIFAEAKNWMIFGMLLISLPVTSGMVRSTEDRFAFWPEAVTSQLQGSDLATFAGFPVWRWFLVDSAPRNNVCVYLPERNQRNAHILAGQFLKLIFDDPKIFNESTKANFLSCPGTKAIYSSAFDQFQPDCKQICEGIDSKWNSCSWQVIDEIKDHPHQRQLVTVCFP